MKPILSQRILKKKQGQSQPPAEPRQMGPTEKREVTNIVVMNTVDGRNLGRESKSNSHSCSQQPIGKKKAINRSVQPLAVIQSVPETAIDLIAGFGDLLPVLSELKLEKAGNVEKKQQSNIEAAISLRE